MVIACDIIPYRQRDANAKAESCIAETTYQSNGLKEVAYANQDIIY